MHESLPIIPYQPHQLDLDKQQAIKYHHSLGSQCFSDYGVSGQELTKLYDTLILINNYFGFGLLIFYEIFTNMILLTFLGQFVASSCHYGMMIMDMLLLTYLNTGLILESQTLRIFVSKSLQIRFYIYIFFLLFFHSFSESIVIGYDIIQYFSLDSNL